MTLCTAPEREQEHSLKSQTDVITGVSEPTALTLVGNDLYFGQFSSHLSKIDITEANPIPEIVAVSNGIYRSHLALNGDYLYFTEPYLGRISRIDITEANPVKEEIASGYTFPNGLAISGNILYFSDQDEATVSKRPRKRI